MSSRTCSRIYIHAVHEVGRSPLTQKKTEAIKYYKQPEIQERLTRIIEGNEWFELTQKLLEQAGQPEGNKRRIKGQTYVLETDGRSVLIMRNDKPIFRATDERKMGGLCRRTQWQ